MALVFALPGAFVPASDDDAPPPFPLAPFFFFFFFFFFWQMAAKNVGNPTGWDWGVSGGGRREGAEKFDEGGKVEFVRCVHGQNGAIGKEAYRHLGKANEPACRL